MEASNQPTCNGRIGVRMVDGLPVPIPPAGRDWLTPDEVARALEVKRGQIYDWTSMGVMVGEIGNRRRVRLARVGLGRKIRIYPDAVLSFLRATSQPPSLASAAPPETVLSDEERQARIDAARRELAALGVDC